jgi:hypothetical protein
MNKSASGTVLVECAVELPRDYLLNCSEALMRERITRIIDGCLDSALRAPVPP